MVKKLKKNRIALKLRSLISPRATFPKTTESELFESKHFTGSLENTFFCKVDTYLKLS